MKKYLFILTFALTAFIYSCTEKEPIIDGSQSTSIETENRNFCNCAKVDVVTTNVPLPEFGCCQRTVVITNNSACSVSLFRNGVKVLTIGAYKSNTLSYRTCGAGGTPATDNFHLDYGVKFGSKCKPFSISGDCKGSTTCTSPVNVHGIPVCNKDKDGCYTITLYLFTELDEPSIGCSLFLVDNYGNNYGLYTIGNADNPTTVTIKTCNQDASFALVNNAGLPTGIIDGQLWESFNCAK